MSSNDTTRLKVSPLIPSSDMYEVGALYELLFEDGDLVYGVLVNVDSANESVSFRRATEVEIAEAIKKYVPKEYIN